VKKQLFAISFLASSFAVSMILTGCASGPEPRQAEEQEASTAQAPQAQPPLVQAPQPQAPQAQPAQPLPAQQQAATMANPPNEDDPNYGGDPVLVEVMTRDQWLQNLKEVLSTELCSQDEIFRSCYPVSEGECRQHIQAITVSCANRYQTWIPEQLHESDRQNWDSQVGECTGGAMSSLLDAVYPVSNAQICQQKLDSST
jgi:hypothetical protein